MASSYSGGAGGMAGFPVLDLEATSALEDFSFGENMTMFSNTNFDEYGHLGGVIDFEQGEAVVDSATLENGTSGDSSVLLTPEGGVVPSGVDFAQDAYRLPDFQGFEHLLGADSALTTATSTASLTPVPQIPDDTHPYPTPNLQSSPAAVMTTPAPAVTTSRNTSATPGGGNKRKAEPVAINQQKKRSNTITSSQASPAASTSMTPGPGGEDPYGLTAEEDKRRRNTAASARFRVKKKQREQALESTAKEMTEKVGNLEARISQLEMENKLLRNLLTEKNGQMDFEQVVDMCKKWAQPQPATTKGPTSVPARVLSGGVSSHTSSNLDNKERGRSRPAQKDGVGTVSSGVIKKPFKAE